MKIIDLTPENESIYFLCLEEWSDEIKESGNHKAKWYAAMKDKGLRVKLAVDDNGTVGGMIQYIPIEYSSFKGENLYMILCIWVHGHKQGRGDYRKKGMGKALLSAAEEDVKHMGKNGLAAWGMIIPVFMRAAWFKKHGYKKVANAGLMQLVWKPFHPDATPPSFLKPTRKTEQVSGKINIDLFMNGWCPAMNMSYERTLRAIKGFEDKVRLNEYFTIDRSLLLEWGRSDAILIDGKELRTGPPPSYKKIRKIIERKANKIK